MSDKSTFEAPANVALVKHWGVRDEEHALPYSPSISMALTVCHSRTTVEHLDEGGDDEVLLAGRDGTLTAADGAFAPCVRRHLDRLRIWAAVKGRFRIATCSSFPTISGSAFAASGFAALTLAAVAALGREASADELSRLARSSGSGSAARSVFGGWVVWPSPYNAPQGPAKQLFPVEHWDVRDIIAVVDDGEKRVSPHEGHRRAPSSALFPPRIGALPSRLAAMTRAIAERDLARLGRLMEADAAELHAVALSSEPPAVYFGAGTLAVLRCVASLREDGVPVYWNLAAGANVHLLCEPDHERAVTEAVTALPEVIHVLRDRVGSGPRRLEEHLF